jgi:hypothetical protein
VDLATKLQLKPGQSLAVHSTVDVAELLPGVTVQQDGDALLVFVTDRDDLTSVQRQIVASAAADRLTWVAYPKAGQLGTDLNRDKLAAALTEHGIRPVRQVSIDELWSALRFRPA